MAVLNIHSIHSIDKTMRVLDDDVLAFYVSRTLVCSGVSTSFSLLKPSEVDRLSMSVHPQPMSMSVHSPNFWDFRFAGTRAGVRCGVCWPSYDTGIAPRSRKLR
jgi:hypothetical protein